MVSRDTCRARGRQDHEEESIALLTVKEHLILLLLKNQHISYTVLPDNGVFQITSKKNHTNVRTKLKARIKLSKVNLNTGQRGVFLFGVVNKQLKRFTFPLPTSFQASEF